jgi:hypothetical protein
MNRAAELQHSLSTIFSVSCFVKSGARMSVIADTVEEEITKLKSDDDVLVLGGSNDAGKNNSKEALRHLCNLVEKRQMVNIVVMTPSSRYDLITSSCVNNEVVRFNR